VAANFVQTLHWTRVTRGATLRSKCQRSRSLERKM